MPLDGSAPFEDLSRSSGLSLDRTRRFLQHAMMRRMFREEPAGQVRHTALSRMLVERPGSFDVLGNMMEEFCPAGTKVLDAMDKPGWSVEEPTYTGFSLYHGTALPVYLDLSRDPERLRRFGSATQFLSAAPEYDLKHFVNGYDWGELDNRTGTPATVVDMGGGKGQVSYALARATKNLQFVVQDLPGCNDLAGPQVNGHSKEDGSRRVKFMDHDFFTPQPIIGAELYFLRCALHNMPPETAQTSWNLVR